MAPGWHLSGRVMNVDHKLLSLHLITRLTGSWSYTGLPCARTRLQLKPPPLVATVHTQNTAGLQLSKHRGDARQSEELMYKYPEMRGLQARAGFSLWFPLISSRKNMFDV